MKKLLMLLVCLFTLQTMVSADNEKNIRINQLPQTAQQFIKQHFADSNVAIVKLETDFLQKNYDVIFTNGNKVEFDKQGNWKEVNCKYSMVPSPIIPNVIQQYISTNYPEAKILKIDRDKKDYELKLSGGLELKFDMDLRLIDMDN